MNKKLEYLEVYSAVLKDKNITSNEALILCLFKQIGLDKKIPNNSYISFCLGIEVNKISVHIKSLIKKGYLVKSSNHTDIQVFEILSKGSNYTNGCKICGYSKSYLDKHHYPIRAKNGGTKTIDLCANCHREFHQLADHNRDISFTLKANNLFRG